MNGCGNRASHLRSNASIFAGLNRSQIFCNPAGSAQAANPLSSAVNSILAFVAWRLAHSLPFTHSFAL